jgi:hypothetical protein
MLATSSTVAASSAPCRCAGGGEPRELQRRPGVALEQAPLDGPRLLRPARDRVCHGCRSGISGTPTDERASSARGAHRVIRCRCAPGQHRGGRRRYSPTDRAAAPSPCRHRFGRTPCRWPRHCVRALIRAFCWNASFAPDARARPGETPVRTALSPRYLIRMRALVQVLAGPPTIFPAHEDAGRSLALAFPAALPGSCHPRATPSGSRVLRLRPSGRHQLVQSGRDSSVPARHDVLVTQGSSRGGVPHPHHQLPVLAPAATARGRCGVAQVMKAQPLDPGRSGGRDPDARVKLLRRIGPPPLGREHQPLRAASA